MILTGIQLKRTPEDENRWTLLLSIAKHSNYMVSMPYAYSKDVDGRFTTSFIFSKDNIDIAGAHYSLVKSSLSLITVSDLKSGILFREDADPEIFRSILDHYLNWAKNNNVSFARINSWLPKIIDDRTITYSAEIEEFIHSKGFIRIVPPKHTYRIDLLQSEEELLKKMHTQTRYRVRQGLRSDIETIVYEKPEDEIIDKFWNQYRKIGEKKNFTMYNEGKFKHEIFALMQANLAKLFVEKFENTIINFSLASNLKIAYNMHGAINPEFKKLNGCPSPGQLAQWEMIRKVKSQGSVIYDMGFCPGPTPILEHPKFPIWSFKHGFGGSAVEFLPVYGKVLKPLRGRLFHFLNKKS
jgi:hypothetical protein